MNNLTDKSAEILVNSRLIFWDFDGVIKDSAEIKAQAYVDIFSECGSEIQSKLKAMYNAAGGVSRYDLIPIFYEELFGKKPDCKQLDLKLKAYSDIVVNKVIGCHFIPGVVAYLNKNYERQRFFIDTNTPKQEIDLILKQLKLDIFFEAGFGAPDQKDDVVRRVLKATSIAPENCVFVGDSAGDFVAARNNFVPFIFRGLQNLDEFDFHLAHFQF